MSFGYQNVPPNQGIIQQVDGFLIGWIRAHNNGERGEIYGEVSFDNGNSFATLSGASVHWYTQSDAHIYFNSFCLPVMKNHIFRVRTNFTAGTPAIGAWFVST